MPNAGGLWARVRLSGRKAARWRFQVFFGDFFIENFMFFFQLALVDCSFVLSGRSAKRPPHRLSLLITRKKRKSRSIPFTWHVSDPKRPKHGHLVVTNNQEPVEFETTLNTKTTIHDVSILIDKGRVVRLL